MTKAFVSAFARTIAIEPKVYLLTQLQEALPTPGTPRIVDVRKNSGL